MSCNRNVLRAGAVGAAAALGLTILSGPVFAVPANADPAGDSGFSVWYEGGRDPDVIGTPVEMPLNLVPQIPDTHAVIASAWSNFPNTSSSTESVASLWDKDPQTKWYSGSSISVGEQSPVVVIYSLKVPALLSSYQLVSGNDEPLRDPKSWKLLASDDPAAAKDPTHSSWVVLDSEQNQSFASRRQARTFQADSSGTAYKYYQLSITELAGVQSDGKQRLQISDWNLVGSVPGAVDAGLKLVRRVATGTTPPAGASAVRYTSKVLANGNARAVVLLHEDLDVAVDSGTHLTYVIRPETSSSASVLADQVHVDLVLADQTGAETVVELGTDGEPIASHRWNSVTVDLSAHAGMTVKKVLVRLSASGAKAGTEFNGYIDNLMIGKSPVTPGTQWSYYDTGDDPAAGGDRFAWTLDGFDTSGWKTGSGGFYALKPAGSFQSPLLKNVEMKWALESGKVVPGYFFRTSFELSEEDIANAHGGYLFVAYDDTATTYMNGVRVTGFGDRYIAKNTDYQNENGPGDPSRRTVSIPIDLFKVGTNVLSVEVHQCNDTSSDAYFYAPSLMLTPKYFNAGFSSADLDRKYPSDTLPTTVNGNNYFVDQLFDFDYLLKNRPDLVAPNAVIPNDEPATALNDLVVLDINNNASDARKQMAYKDGHGNAVETMWDGFGPVLGPLYATALAEGRLPKTQKLAGERVEKYIGDHDSPKKYWLYKRPYERMGFQDEGGKIVRVDDEGTYNNSRGSGSFPSGHTNWGFMRGTTLATLVPQVGDSMMLRSQEYGYSRIVLTFHYPLDVMGGGIVGQNVAQMRWSDPAFRVLLNSAKAEIQAVLAEDCGYDTIDECLAANGVADPKLSEEGLQLYKDHLTYGFPAIRATDDPFIVPEGAGNLLLSKHPNLTLEQRNSIIEETAIPSGQPLDRSADGVYSWQRVNLAAAFAADVYLREDGKLVVNGRVIGEQPLTLVSPVAPSRVGNAVAIPVVEGVVYQGSDGATLTGSVDVPKDGTLVVKAVPADGFVFPDGATTQWSFAFQPVAPTVVSPVAPLRGGNTVGIPVVEGVVYQGSDGTTLTGSVDVPKDGTLVVKAVPASGFVFAEGATTQWSFAFQPVAPTVVSPVAPSRVGNAVAIPVVEGVVYQGADGTMLTGSVDVPKDGTLVVKAVAADGFVFPEGATTEWSFDFEATPPTEPVVVRHGGLTRYDTSFEVAREVLVAGKPLFVATGLNFPDALAGGAAAAHVDGALILVGSKVPDATLALLGEKKPSEVYVLGGSGAVSELVVSQLKTATGVTPVRLSGKNRFETASKVASTFFAGATCAYVASGDDYPDALAASGKAGRDGCPIILFGRGTADLPATANSVFIVGGKGVIPEAYKDKLDHAGMSVTRFAGLDRFGTSQALQEVGASEVWVANGFSFPDALSAAAPSGKAGATMVLARKGCIPLGAKPVIEDPGVSRVHLVGGSGVLNQDVFNLKYCNN